MIINPFHSCLTEANLISAASVATTASKWVEIGRYTVPAGTGVAIGYKNLHGMDQAEGRLYFKLRDAANAVEKGMIRLELRDPQDRPIEVLKEWRSEQLETSATDRQQQIPLPEHDSVFGEDWSLVFMFKGDATDGLTLANCSILLDTTVYTVR